MAHLPFPEKSHIMTFFQMFTIWPNKYPNLCFLWVLGMDITSHFPSSYISQWTWWSILHGNEALPRRHIQLVCIYISRSFIPTLDARKPEICEIRPGNICKTWFTLCLWPMGNIKTIIHAQTHQGPSGLWLDSSIYYIYTYLEFYVLNDLTKIMIKTTTYYLLSILVNVFVKEYSDKKQL